MFIPLILDDVVEEELDEVPCLLESSPNLAVAAATMACEAAEAAAASLRRLEADPLPPGPTPMPAGGPLPDPLPSNSFFSFLSWLEPEVRDSVEADELLEGNCLKLLGAATGGAAVALAA